MIIRKVDIHLDHVSHNSKNKKLVFLSKGILPNLLQFAKSDFKKDDIIEPHHHNSMLEVFYILKGRLIVTINDQSNELGADEVFVVRANQNHSIKFLEDSTMLYFNLDDKN